MNTLCGSQEILLNAFSEWQERSAVIQLFCVCRQNLGNLDSHLTNTCHQQRSSSPERGSVPEEDAVKLLSELPQVEHKDLRPLMVNNLIYIQLRMLNVQTWIVDFSGVVASAA